MNSELKKEQVKSFLIYFRSNYFFQVNKFQILCIIVKLIWEMANFSAQITYHYQRNIPLLI